jgi:hypothetical protein
MKQHMLSLGALLNDQGTLHESGYATYLVKSYDRAAIKASKLKIKEWDYYLIYNEDFGIALTMADNAYMGLLSASFLDFKAKTEKTLSPMVILPLGRMKMPASSEVGDVHFSNTKVEMEFYHEENGRRLTLNMPNFDNEFPLIADILLKNEPMDSMVIVTPFKETPNAFYYNQKIIGMRAEGVIIHQGRQMEVSSDTTFGLLDWGRGVWTYDNTWYWSAGQGLIDGHVFGFNLGYGFGDTQDATENMIFLDGIAHKLEEVTFKIPQNADGSDDYMKPWLFTSNNGRFEALFTPILDRAAYTSLAVLFSDQHQVFGKFDGIAILDDGTKVVMKHFLGFAEKVRNKW